VQVIPEIGKQLLVPGMLRECAAQKPAAPLDLALQLAVTAHPLPPDAATALAAAAPAVATWAADELNLDSLGGDRAADAADEFTANEKLAAAADILAVSTRSNPAARVWPEADGGDALLNTMLQLAWKLAAALGDGLPPPAHDVCAEALGLVLTGLAGLAPPRLAAGAARKLLHIAASLVSRMCEEQRLNLGGQGMDAADAEPVSALQAALHAAVDVTAAACRRASPTDRQVLLDALVLGVEATTQGSADTMVQRLAALAPLAVLLEVVMRERAGRPAEHAAAGALAAVRVLRFCDDARRNGSQVLMGQLPSANALAVTAAAKALVAEKCCTFGSLVPVAANRAAMTLARDLSLDFKAASEPRLRPSSRLSPAESSGLGIAPDAPPTLRLIVCAHASDALPQLTAYLRWPLNMFRSPIDDSAAAASSSYDAAAVAPGAWAAGEVVAMLLGQRAVRCAAACSECSQESDLVGSLCDCFPDVHLCNAAFCQLQNLNVC